MSTPLRDLLHDLLFEPPARAAFSADPESYLGEHGWDDLRGQDVEAALDALTDELPPEQAALLAPLTDGEGAFDDGLAGAIAGLEAAASAVDGELQPLLTEPSDPSATLDDLEEAEVDEPAALVADEVDPTGHLDDLPFGTRQGRGGSEDVSDDAEGDSPDVDEADTAADVDLGEHPLELGPDTDALWSHEDDDAVEPDEPDDDVID